MATTHLPPDFKEFLQLLNSHKVKYLLIGGYAVGYHGYPRATADMDVWIAVHPQNAEKIVAVLEEFGFNVPELSKDIFLKENKVIRMGVPPVKIAILTSASGVDFEECYAERTLDILNGVEVNIISLKCLKTNKKASGRHKDLNDLEHLP
ncbi:MAG: hypothetical protein U9R15_04775 [Chloroflexota bacterium]|nr:hypothetical protein [Chloroflexota bacterium]